MASILPQTAFRVLRTVPRAASPLPRAIVRLGISTQLPRAQPLFHRFVSGVPQEQPRLRLGATGMILLAHRCNRWSY